MKEYLSIEEADRLVAKVPGIGDSKLHLVTVATHCELYFPALLMSSHILGYRLNVLGWGQKWGHFRWKVEKVMEFCKTLPPNDIVFCVDAFDVCLLQPPHILVEKFLNTKVDFLCGGEQPTKTLFSVFHNVMFKEGDLPSWPQRDNGVTDLVNLSYLNAGTWIAKASIAESILKMIPPNELNDQRYFSTLYLLKHGIGENKLSLENIEQKIPRYREIKDINLDIDYRCQLFFLARDFDTSHASIVTREEAVSNYPVWKENYVSKTSYNDNYLKGILVDLDMKSAPCAVHMYCRGNYDGILKLLGLPDAIPDFKGIIYYAYYSFLGCWHIKGYLAMIAATVVGVVSLVALVVYLFMTSVIFLRNTYNNGIDFNLNQISKPSEFYYLCNNVNVDIDNNNINILNGMNCNEFSMSDIENLDLDLDDPLYALIPENIGVDIFSDESFISDKISLLFESDKEINEDRAKSGSRSKMKIKSKKYQIMKLPYTPKSIKSYKVNRHKKDEF